MTTTQGEPKRPDSRELEGGLLEAVVCENVLSALGRPDASHRIQARRVGGDRYRVNVFVADSAATFRVAHSYFLEADSNGNILTSTPPITRVY